MAVTAQMKKERLIRISRLRSFIAAYLETQTYWGKHMARPSQIRAAAKKMQSGRHIPVPVAKALGMAA